MVTRLSGGLTPGDGADPRTFPAIWNDTADVIESQGSAISGAESDIDTLESDVAANGTAITGLQSDVSTLQSDLDTAESDIDTLESDVAANGTAISELQSDLLPTDIVSPAAGEKLVFDGTNWVNLEAYALVEVLTFTSNGTFTKASYPWLRAIRVKLQGGGGGSGAAVDLDRSSGAGAGGGYGEKFITNIAGMGASEAVTVGDGGSAGVVGGTENGGNGGVSSFFGAQANGGGGGNSSSGSFGFAAGGGTSGVDFGINGARGASRIGFQPLFAVYGGSAFLSPPDTIAAQTSSIGGLPGIPFGGGSSQALKTGSTDQGGGTGASGIVILELFA